MHIRSASDNVLFEAIEAKNTHIYMHACTCVSIFLSIDTVLFVVCVNDHRVSMEPYLALSSMDYAGYLI